MGIVSLPGTVILVQPCTRGTSGTRDIQPKRVLLDSVGDFLSEVEEIINKKKWNPYKQVVCFLHLNSPISCYNSSRSLSRGLDDCSQGFIPRTTRRRAKGKLSNQAHDYEVELLAVSPTD